VDILEVGRRVTSSQDSRVHCESLEESLALEEEKEKVDGDGDEQQNFSKISRKIYKIYTDFVKQQSQQVADRGRKIRSLSDHLNYQSTINTLFKNSDAFNLDISVFRQSLNSNTTPRRFRIAPNLPSTKQQNKYTFPYASFIAAKSFMSARNTFTLTTDFKLDPAASKTAPKFFKHCVYSQSN